MGGQVHDDASARLVGENKVGVEPNCDRVDVSKITGTAAPLVSGWADLFGVQIQHSLREVVGQSFDVVVAEVELGEADSLARVATESSKRTPANAAPHAAHSQSAATSCCPDIRRGKSTLQPRQCIPLSEAVEGFDI